MFDKLKLKNWIEYIGDYEDDKIVISSCCVSIKIDGEKKKVFETSSRHHYDGNDILFSTYIFHRGKWIEYVRELYKQTVYKNKQVADSKFVPIDDSSVFPFFEPRNRQVSYRKIFFTASLVAFFAYLPKIIPLVISYLLSHNLFHH